MSLMEIRKKKKSRSHRLIGEQNIANPSGYKHLRDETASEPSSICVNGKCKLRKAAGGCSGFEGCPGFKTN